MSDRPTLPAPAAADPAPTLPQLGPTGTLPAPADGPPAALPTADRYEIGDEIARGGMGAVHAARDRVLNRTVAVKVLLDGPFDRAAATTRFVAEARIASQLQHPGVPPVYDLGERPDGRPFLAMKLIKGRTLAELLKERPDPTYDQPRFVQIFEQVAQTMAYSHSRGVIHRDLKPLNVMVGAFGEVQVMDWGLSKVLGDPASSSPELAVNAQVASVIDTGREDSDHTRAGSVMGTPAYMPPEQARGDVERVDRRADVFALGAILCEILTGQPPYTGTFSEMRAKATLGQLDETFIRLDGSGVDAELVTLTKRFLSANSAERPANAGEVASAVGAYRAGVDERLRKAEVDRAAAGVRAAEERKRRRVWIGLSAAGVALLTVLWAVILWADKRYAALQELDRRQLEAALADVTAERDRTAAALADTKVARGKTVEALKKLMDHMVEEQETRQLADTLREQRYFQDVQRLWEEMATTGGDTEDARALRAEGAFQVAMAKYNLDRFTDAEAGFRAAADQYRKLAADYPTNAVYQGDLARSLTILGHLLQYAAKRPVDAEQAYHEAAAVRTKMVADFPDHPEYRDSLASLQMKLAMPRHPDRSPDARQVCEDAYRVLTETEPHYRAALSIDPNRPDARQFLSVNRLLACQALLYLGEYRAIPLAAAEMVEYAKAPVAPDTYNAAVFLARCVPLIEKDAALFGPIRYLLARQYADQAMDHLRQVVNLDYKYATPMRTAPDFIPLRGRPDFRQLLSELESRSKLREPAPPPRPAKP